MHKRKKKLNKWRWNEKHFDGFSLKMMWIICCGIELSHILFLWTHFHSLHCSSRSNLWKSSTSARHSVPFPASTYVSKCWVISFRILIKHLHTHTLSAWCMHYSVIVSALTAQCCFSTRGRMFVIDWSNCKCLNLKAECSADCC